MFVKTLTADPIRPTAEKKEGDEASSASDRSFAEAVGVGVVEIGVIEDSREGIRWEVFDRLGSGSGLTVVSRVVGDPFVTLTVEST